MVGVIKEVLVLVFLDAALAPHSVLTGFGEADEDGGEIVQGAEVLELHGRDWVRKMVIF